jgi:hypothetical protein
MAQILESIESGGSSRQLQIWIFYFYVENITGAQWGKQNKTKHVEYM